MTSIHVGISQKLMTTTRHPYTERARPRASHPPHTQPPALAAPSPPHSPHTRWHCTPRTPRTPHAPLGASHTYAAGGCARVWHCAPCDGSHTSKPNGFDGTPHGTAGGQLPRREIPSPMDLPAPRARSNPPARRRAVLARGRREASRPAPARGVHFPRDWGVVPGAAAPRI